MKLSGEYFFQSTMAGREATDIPLNQPRAHYRRRLDVASKPLHKSRACTSCSPKIPTHFLIHGFTQRNWDSTHYDDITCYMHDLPLRMQAFCPGMRWGSGAGLQGSPSWVHHFLVCLLAQMKPWASICSVKWASNISQTPWSRGESQTSNNRCRTRSTPGL